VEDIDEAEEPEEWETGEGIVVSEVIAWEPEYEAHPPGDDDQVHISEERIAVSADAVQTKEIHDATFRFAKTLTMPFMGAGVVDLPPGSEKRPKNSRKMHMVFFVHYGKVAVTVNEGQFRISAGGQWFVPRGECFQSPLINFFLFRFFPPCRSDFGARPSLTVAYRKLLQYKQRLPEPSTHLLCTGVRGDGPAARRLRVHVTSARVLKTGGELHG
jgi:mannose-6-phosphate isomerase-like protein (cupin superfamily)